MLRKFLMVIGLCAMSLGAENRIFEMRTYHTVSGRLPALLERFQQHTTKLFEKHGMQNIGYWIPVEQPNTLVYILAYKDRDAAKSAWEAFRKDPEWVKARTASEESGKIVEKVDSVFMNAADFSKIK